MLRLVFGRAGSGKTAFTLEKADEIARMGGEAVVIVPEQFTFETERVLTGKYGPQTCLNIEVLSFSRLCERVFSLAKETLDPLLGTKPDPELVRQLRDGILHYDYITGSHDLMIHNYGPGRTIASIHAEVPCDVSVLKLHESIDLAEKEMSEKLDIILIIHMDPLNNDDEKVRAAYSETIDLLRNYSEVKSIHDFRIVGDSEKKNLVFDIVVDSKKVVSKKDEQALKEKIDATIKQNHPLYNAIVSIDQDYTEN
ncbi:MAG TPA: cation transporter dimerization domain-containing protein [Clostridia bacterium]|nr:cation transporter dimerization domain-containing protein [Clostridia bacterium]